MTDEPEEDRLALIERIRQMFREFGRAKSPADIPPNVLEEFTHLRERLLKIALTSHPSSELAEFSNRLKARQGTKMIDFNALYEYCDSMDRKLITGE